MSDDQTMPAETHDPLRALGKQLAYDRPDAARRDSVRSSLLVAASEGRQPAAARTRWILVGGGFVAGALAAAAVAVLLLRGDVTTSPSTRRGIATIESSSAAELERSTVATATGTDELVRVRSGTLRLAVPTVRTGDHVRLQTGDAEVEGSGAYEVVVSADALASVTVATGTATIRVKGQQQAVFLAAGETWRAPVITADLDIAPVKPDVVAPSADVAIAPTADVVAPTADVVAPTNVAPSAPTPAVTAIAPTTKSNPSAVTAIAPTTKSNPSAVTAIAPTTKSNPSAVTAIAPTTSVPKTSAPAPVATAPSTSSASNPTTVSSTASTSPSTPTAVAPRPSITAVADPAPPTATGNSPTETHFRAGYALLRANRHLDAAAELGKAADGDGPLAADARYFQAVALSKAGRGRDAERALVAFLDRAPTSVRRGRASVMLARLLVERGDTKSARAWFESALADTDPSVATAASEGIESLK